MLQLSALLTALLCGALQGAPPPPPPPPPIDGTWELTRIFRSGAARTWRAVPIDSSVYLRMTLKTMPGDGIDGRMYRRYHGREERGKIEAGAQGRTGRYMIRAGL